MAEQNCAKCNVTLNVNKVYLGRLVYCPACTDAVDEHYVTKVREYLVKNAKP